MIGILYLGIFIFTLILEVLIIKKSKDKKWLWIVIYLFFCISGVFIGSFLGEKASELNRQYLQEK